MKVASGQLVLVDQDSILIAVPANRVALIAAEIARVFASPIPWLGIALSAVIKVGPNWGELR